jgi:cytochrome c-type biogenesis protein CcmF
MKDFGHFSLCCAWFVTLYGLLILAFGGKSLQTIKSGLAALPLSFVCLAFSFYSLARSFLNNDYTLQYVWQYSNKSMPDIYKVTAIWGGMDGSMLLWCLILSVSGLIFSLRFDNKVLQLMRWTGFTFLTSLFFFESVTIFLTNPYRFLNSPIIPSDGLGLNPLLQNPYMAIHPPMLYMGFTTFALPYSFCMGALLANMGSSDWIRYSRYWTLGAWIFLTTGIVLGGHWAYLELGWGGFWAWDPVENASFLPWLTGTAFLHSVVVQERKGMLKAWNFFLITITYALTVFGTFLTRSGLVQSVHSFAETDIGWVFLLYLGLVLACAVFIAFKRKSILTPDRFIKSFFSREVAFLVNNLLLVSICFAVFWGVMFPVFSEALTGEKQTVGIPFFNRVTIPLFLLLLFTMSIGPLVPWRKGNVKTLLSMLRLPFVAALATAVLFVWAGVTSYYATISYALSAFALIAIGGEFHRGVKVKKEKRSSFCRFLDLFRRHPSRYGGLVVHIGVIITCIGITASMAHKVEREFTLGKGEQVEVGRFRFQLEKLSEEAVSDFDSVKANVSVYDLFDKKLYELDPELRYYKARQETTSEVALHMSLREDVYMVLAGTDSSGLKASIKLYLNPLQVWLWIGALIMVFGTLLAMLPRNNKQTVEQAY